MLCQGCNTAWPPIWSWPHRFLNRLLPGLDFRLNVFYTVAKRLSFTEAAADLFVTQPALTKHMQELESQFGMALFDRRGNQISLTTAGQVLFRHAEGIIALYRQAEFDMNALKGQTGGQLRLGASSTVAQYVIPAVLARFGEQSPGVNLSLMSGNTEQIEQALLNNDIDLGLVEGWKSRFVGQRNPSGRLETNDAGRSFMDVDFYGLALCYNPRLNDSIKGLTCCISTTN